jgi:hypothetical protein
MLRDIRRRLRGTLAQGDAIGAPALSPWDLLFERLEILAVEKGMGEPLRPLSVTTGHLVLLEQALDSLAAMGFPNLLPVDVYRRSIVTRLSVKGYPLAADIRDLQSYAILRERERWAYKIRVLVEDDEQDGELSVVLDDSDAVVLDDSDAGVQSSPRDSSIAPSDRRAEPGSPRHSSIARSAPASVVGDGRGVDSASLQDDERAVVGDETVLPAPSGPRARAWIKTKAPLTALSPARRARPCLWKRDWLAETRSPRPCLGKRA